MLLFWHGQDKPQVAGYNIVGELASKRQQDGVADRRLPVNDIRVPEPDHPVSGVAHISVPYPITGLVHMLAPIYLNDQSFFTADEIRKIWPEGKLANEFVTTESSGL